ncbi:hypothetical protein CTAYLR_001103 [Chrysophaeum taylorii]|uniref:Uncharacterized protein n=1 Tax=Chrysophaeum taylorii TaxID=2483200 RepID=A0AAD7XQM8_9STRA|nr:hypothetical protein CTAYLR_001103 [Chrysophaeum taylorii]
MDVAAFVARNQLVARNLDKEQRAESALAAELWSAREFRCAVVGDRGVGKSSLVRCLAGVLQKTPIDDCYEPTLTEAPVETTVPFRTIEGVVVLRLVDWAWDDAYLRGKDVASHLDVDAGVYVVSSADPGSAKSLTVRFAELDRVGSSKTMVVATKLDLRKKKDILVDFQNALRKRDAGVSAVSCADGRGLDDLAQKLVGMLLDRRTTRVLGRHDRADLFARTSDLATRGLLLPELAELVAGPLGLETDDPEKVAVEAKKAFGCEDGGPVDVRRTLAACAALLQASDQRRRGSGKEEEDDDDPSRSVARQQKKKKNKQRAVLAADVVVDAGAEEENRRRAERLKAKATEQRRRSARAETERLIAERLRAEAESEAQARARARAKHRAQLRRLAGRGPRYVATVAYRAARAAKRAAADARREASQARNRALRAYFEHLHARVSGVWPHLLVHAYENRGGGGGGGGGVSLRITVPESWRDKPTHDALARVAVEKLNSLGGARLRRLFGRKKRKKHKATPLLTPREVRFETILGTPIDAAPLGAANTCLFVVCQGKE